MKAKIMVSGLILSIITLFSCKEKTEKIEEPKIITFDVTLDVIVPKDDMLIVHYLEAKDDWFTGDKSVWVKVSGSEQEQKCTFSLPEGILPKDVRLDISSEKEQQKITLNGITLSYNGNQFQIQKQDIDKYFVGNEFVKFDTKTNIASLSRVNNNFDPFFNSRPILYPEFQKLVITKQLPK